MIIFFFFFIFLFIFLTVVSFLGMIETKEEAPTSIFICCMLALGLAVLSWHVRKKESELNAIKAGVAQYKVDSNGKVTFEFIQVKTKDIEKHEP